MAAEVQSVCGESVTFKEFKEMFVPTPGRMPHPMNKEDGRWRIKATPWPSRDYLDIVRLHASRKLPYEQSSPARKGKLHFSEKAGGLGQVILAAP